ncbi:MAG: hypothetical protein JSU96_08450 [Acidobacteriota bacterium]|nr:MAG: hypothetical protein JSU96_08450 [Acidobacteriota bacterium]
MDSIEQTQKLQEFMAREFDWGFSAGECNFLIQLLAHLVQENPRIVVSAKGEREPLNYQSIRTIVLLNEKLSGQLQKHAQESSVVMGDVKSHTDRVQ